MVTGGPGTGKSSIIDELIKRGFTCFNEFSRQVTLEAQKKGIEQLFLTDPFSFSKRIIEGRQKQYEQAEYSNQELVFLDRGVHDVLAYMDFKGDVYPKYFNDICKSCAYDFVFILKPWESIYTSDNERYENFEQATLIHDHLLRTYKRYFYDLLDVPFDTVENRANHILRTINNL